MGKSRLILWVNGHYIGSVERGEQNISLMNIHRIAEALEMPPARLME